MKPVYIDDHDNADWIKRATRGRDVNFTVTQSIEFGDVEGHPFHGNQWTGSRGSEEAPVQQDLSGAKEDWYSSHVGTRKIREAADALIQTGKTPTGTDAAIAADAKLLLNAARNGDPSDAPLYRGMGFKGDVDTVRQQFPVGAEVEIGLGSFSSDKSVADKFGQWSWEELRSPERPANEPEVKQPATEVFFVVPRGTPSFNISYGEDIPDYFKMEKESIVSGNFRVADVKTITIPTMYDDIHEDAEHDALQVQLEAV